MTRIKRGQSHGLTSGDSMWAGPLRGGVSGWPDNELLPTPGLLNQLSVRWHARNSDPATASVIPSAANSRKWFLINAPHLAHASSATRRNGQDRCGRVTNTVQSFKGNATRPDLEAAEIWDKDCIIFERFGSCKIGALVFVNIFKVTNFLLRELNNCSYC